VKRRLPENAVESISHVIFRGFDSDLPDSKTIGQCQGRHLMHV
jgi:hypothetical protein